MYDEIYFANAFFFKRSKNVESEPSLNSDNFFVTSLALQNIEYLQERDIFKYWSLWYSLQKKCGRIQTTAKNDSFII